MTARTFNELFEPTIRLSLAHVHADRYIVWDQHCRYYLLSPSPLPVCLRFMRAGADRGDWLIDEASVERATWSVRVPERCVVETRAGKRRCDLPVGHEGDHMATVRVPDGALSDNVRPIRREIA